jgi:hypothetical protein
MLLWRTLTIRTTQWTMQSMLALRAFLVRKNNSPPSHPKRRKGKGERGGSGQCIKQEQNIIYCLGGPEMLKSSPMLGSVYSCIKELLRKTPSEYKDYK